MGGGPVVKRSTDVLLKDRYVSHTGKTMRRDTPNKWAHGYDGQMAGMLEAANIDKPWWWIKDKEADQ